MKRLIILILILLVLFIPACSSEPEQYSELETRAVDAADVQFVFIQIDYGEVTILRSEDNYVEISGQVLLVDQLEYLVSSTGNQVSIKVFAHRDNFSKTPLYVTVRLPQQIRVKVESNNASIFVQDYRGDLEVASTSGNIMVEGMTGWLTLRSNRGSISVSESSGNISVVGNYGALTVRNVIGETAVSTIMGNILFEGLIQAGDLVHLEADHGSVSVNLSANSALTLQVRSTSGDVTCMLSGMTSTTRTCDGEFNANGGDLSIRTVSGAVTLQSTP